MTTTNTRSDDERPDFVIEHLYKDDLSA